MSRRSRTLVTGHQALAMVRPAPPTRRSMFLLLLLLGPPPTQADLDSIRQDVAALKQSLQTAADPAVVQQLSERVGQLEKRLAQFDEESATQHVQNEKAAQVNQNLDQRVSAVQEQVTHLEAS